MPRIDIEKLAGGCALDMSALVRAALTDLLGLLGEEKSDWFERLDAVVNTAGVPSDVERLESERLLEDLTDAVSTRVALYGSEVARLAGRLSALGSDAGAVAA